MTHHLPRRRSALLAAPLLFALSGASFAADVPAWLDEAVKAETTSMTTLRHDLHAHPELGNQEVRTQKVIADFLKAAGVDEVVVGWKDAPTAVVGVLNPGKGNAVGLRADIDALPIKERTGLPFESKARGTYWGKDVDVSHMCGHDAHMAMLLTAAKILAAHKNEVDRTVVFVFQPAEEGDSRENPFLAKTPKLSGAKALVENGLMEKYGIRTMFGIHVMARVPAGEAWVVKGPALNSADAFEVTITGNQAHGAMPWSGTDATLAAAQTVVSLQQIVSRNANLSEGSGVITVGKLQSGETGNVMSGSAYMQGTIRSNNPGVRSTLLKRIPEVVSGTAAASGVKAETRLIEIYPVTVNDPALAERMVPDLTAFGVKASEVKYNPGASEDFSFYAEKVPSVFVFLGVDAPGAKDAPNNHSDRFVINDDALPAGVRVHLAAVLGDASKSVK